MLYNDVTPFSFHIELTDKCNARCPQCSRNVIDPKTKVLKERDNLPLVEIYFEDFKNIFSDFKFDIQRLNFCGNYGDPFFTRDILPITEWVGKELISNSNTFQYIYFHTNGGMNSPKWWKNYGEICAILFPKKHMVTFSIDGLEDTHHIYRVNTRYHRVVENARAFIEGGGSAEWSFIKFGHNQHQVEEARSLAKKYGFLSFIPVSTQRFFGKLNKEYIYNNKEFEITVATDKASQKRSDKVKTYFKTEEKIIEKAKANISCHVQKRQELFIDCLGDVHPCCWIGSHIYREKYIGKNHWNSHPVFEMREDRNAIEESLNDIIYDDFFQYTLPQSFKYNPCSQCVKQCSSADVKTVKIREFIR